MQLMQNFAIPDLLFLFISLWHVCILQMWWTQIVSTNRVISTTFVTHHFRIVLNFNVKTIKASPEYWVRDACLYKVKDVQSSGRVAFSIVNDTSCGLSSLGFPPHQP